MRVGWGSMEPSSSLLQPRGNPPLPRTRWQQRMRRLCVILSILLAAAVIVYALAAPQLIQAIYEQRSWPALNRLAHPERHPLEHYYQKGRTLLTRGIVVCTLAML